MRNIALKMPVLDLDGNPIPNTDLAGLLAQALIQSSGGPAIKHLDWAITLKQRGNINVDQADFESLKAFVEALTTLTTLAKGQILKTMLTPGVPAVPKATEAETEPTTQPS